MVNGSATSMQGSRFLVWFGSARRLQVSKGLRIGERSQLGSCVA
jgi:hypothetical protein